MLPNKQAFQGTLHPHSRKHICLAVCVISSLFPISRRCFSELCLIGRWLWSTKIKSHNWKEKSKSVKTEGRMEDQDTWPTLPLPIYLDTIKDRNGEGLTEAEEIKKRWKEYTEELYRKDLNKTDNHHAVVTLPEPDVLECEVKWALEGITTNKAWLPRQR